MSGPCCKSCKYYHPSMLSKDYDGVCTDPAKRISVKSGDYVNSEPSVFEFCTCINHITEEIKND